MTTKIFTILALVPISGLAFFYSLFIYLKLFHLPENSWRGQNPDSIGGDVVNWLFPVLCVTTGVLILSLLYYIIARMSGTKNNFTSKNIAMLLGSGIIEVLLFTTDPGYYVVWLFD